MYIILFDKVRADPDSVPHGREGFYFGASGEHTLYDIGKTIGQALVDIGRAKSAEPTTFSKEELDKYFGGVCSFHMPHVQIIYTIRLSQV